MKKVQISKARAAFSAIVDRAARGKATVITRHGVRVAVVVSYDEWRRVSKFPSFGKLLMSMPAEPGDIPDRFSA